VAARLESDEAARRLEAALEQVAAERDAKTRFIAAASHDLGQPLQAANLFFSQMERTKDASHRTQAAEGVRRAFSSAEQLLSHMLNHLRLEADAVDPHSSVMSVGDAIARAAAQFAPAAQNAGIALKAVKTRQLLFADKVLVDRVLGNLVDNAIRHSGAKRILIGARRIGRERLRLYVIDDGVGIPPAEAERVFDDYFTGSESRAITRSGFGLGLSSVRRIAALLDGTVAIDGRWQRGAAFVLDFPSIASAAVRVKKGRVSA
jgi:signal transduction histidine kinase